MNDVLGLLFNYKVRNEVLDFGNILVLTISVKYGKLLISFRSIPSKSERYRVTKVTYTEIRLKSYGGVLKIST